MQEENADLIGAWVQALGNFFAALGSSLPDSEASLATNLGIYGNELQALGGGVQYVGSIRGKKERMKRVPFLLHNLCCLGRRQAIWSEML
ncbi:hypothetical protein AJ85_16305 [Alkalihalobacillus alcalophilus ATCC 27647 = CGMCC 1.3604]|uniref:Uncharacterized protein n=1 Tax=Alkalihalobacillus alcalophilus ATCC 27647 = CGMCC 1.3604 TaxID=1218173 RepID=A0A094YVQ3_ALKAL|nr:hypothetical protein [Alkalihalobacillus alcalophilus]KGA97597.1 hypothetical protein BALCAV_0209080 [Alkalihalobacillus alcalophilus ATCC 27647 = CGMCC 1.3604]MED1561382.1 hypothetical protein [Alkalihalobacillus alcalophilus]THG92180.1 hypothetical protein AJ85_16305 [Alkalihalobacillus alcalophilus ATCC 27647 = CGMCC 1.3604]